MTRKQNKTTMKKIIAAVFMVTMMVFHYNNSFAQKPAVVTTNEPGWHHIGHVTASFKTQNESITVLGADEFTALKIKVSEAGLHIDRLQVFYESGDMEDIDVREHFASGSESQKINLIHPDKDIKKIAFTYRTEPNAAGEKADIDVYGLKTNQPAGSNAYREEKRDMKEDANDVKRDMKNDARDADEKVEKDAQSVGDKIEEGAKDAAAAITDQKLKDKVGPDGETAYVDENGKYYIINNSGEKVFKTKLQLKDKPHDK
jgi:hypothetical protein